MIRKNLVGLYLGRPIMARKILWAFSWAIPLWPAKSHGPLGGPVHYDTKNLVGLLLGWPIMDRKILWAFSWAGPFKLYGPLLGRSTCQHIIGPSRPLDDICPNGEPTRGFFGH